MAIAGIELFAIIGFLLAAYSAVANDAIQTLGTFLSSNSKRPWWVLWLFAGSIVVLVMLKGYFLESGDIAFDRLDTIPFPADGVKWWHVVPPLFLLFLTRYGIPVSTTFLILTIFTLTMDDQKTHVFSKMLTKSALGYVVAFVAAGVLYTLISRAWERWISSTKDQTLGRHWIAAQWGSTAFLWWQWLEQDLANLFVFLPRTNTDVQKTDPVTGELMFEKDAAGNLTNVPEMETFVTFSPAMLILGTVAIVVLLGIIFYLRGGSIQKIVLSKTNTTDIRSATIVNVTFGVILWIFKEQSNIPMSTTWVFLGLIAGREIAISYVTDLRTRKEALRDVGMDSARALLGLVVSVVLAVAIPWAATGNMPTF